MIYVSFAKNKYILNTTKTYLNNKVNIEKNSDVQYNEIYWVIVFISRRRGENMSEINEKWSSLEETT